MIESINRVAVIGSGVMGASIAAHLANIGIQTLLLDIPPTVLTQAEEQKGLTLEDQTVKNRLVANGKRALLKQSPSPITSKASLERIQIGNLEDDIEQIATCDWIIEVVVEDLSIKQKTLKEIDSYRRKGTIVSSNTSGISLAKIVEHCSEDLRHHFLGTHFFNPPRYLKLLEIIATHDTLPTVVQFMKDFGEERLGKGVVEAKDTPNFIANRIGTYGLLITVQEMLKSGLSIGEVDSVTGTVIGRPKSATFRTLDVVGLDTFIHVANNVYEQVTGAEKQAFAIPPTMQKIHDKGWLGEKSGQGFYRKIRGEKGSLIYELNLETFEYEKRKNLTSSALEKAKQMKSPADKLKALIYTENDRAGSFVWSILKRVMIYAAEHADEIADNIVAIDQAMCWGFGWEKGPFETWDDIGLRQSVKRMRAEGEVVPKWILKLLDDGYESFYKDISGNRFYYHHGTYEQQVRRKKDIQLQHLKTKKTLIKQNAGCSLIDLGDGIACLEFHSQSNALGLDAIQMVIYAINESMEKYDGLIIGNQGRHFCVGANLALMLMEAQDDNYFELEMVVQQFQKMTMAIKYAKKPIVVAPFQMTLGGGAEVALPAAAIQASMETYIGLVECGVGLIPGGGGTKELYLKKLRHLPKGIDFNLQPIANDVFEKIALAKVSTSAEEAREYGFLDAHDSISVNQDHLLYDAKQKAISLVETGYTPPMREKIPVVGESGYATMLLGAKSLQTGGYASAHDVKIAEKLAYVLSGGRIKTGAKIDEQFMLDLEREAFLSLIGEPLTQARMQYMLMKGKPLRN